MKFYSEILNQKYNTAKECEEAEAKFKAQQEASSASTISAQKKELVKAIEAAELDIVNASKNYDKAKEEARKIMEKSNAEMQAFLEPAQKALDEAIEAKYSAIHKFNKKFGPYTTTYDSSKVQYEFDMLSKFMDGIFGGWAELL